MCVTSTQGHSSTMAAGQGEARWGLGAKRGQRREKMLLLRCAREGSLGALGMALVHRQT